METPYYLFDLEIVKQRIQYLASHLPDATLCYAMKANPYIAQYVSKLVDHIEVCSPGELDLCEKGYVEDRKIVLSGVNKERRLLDELIASKRNIGIYTIESCHQYFMLKELSNSYQHQITVLIRLSSGNQFGVDEKMLDHIIHDDHPYLNIKGIQFYSSTNKTSIKKIKRELTKLSELSQQYDFHFIEYGPGLPVTYFQEDLFDEEAFLHEFNQLCKEIAIPFVLEIGRSIAYSCGSYYTKVVDLKTTNNENYVILDGGMHQIVYYGQTLAMKHPLIKVNNQSTTTCCYHLCGSLCNSNDILVKNIELPVLNLEDELCFLNTGAYCMSEGIALFLTRDLPAIYLKQNEEIKCIRKSIQVSEL